MIVLDALSKEKPVDSGVPQRSVLGPLLFLVYVNDLPTLFQSQCLLYADDLKLWRTIESAEDARILQDDLQTLSKWVETWLLPLNLSKCVHMKIGKTGDQNSYSIQGQVLRSTPKERDLGVILSSSLKTQANTIKVCGAANGIVGAIRRSFGSISQTAFKTLYASHIRPRLEYGSVATYPCTAGEMNKLEQVQRRATRMVEGLRGVEYGESLDALGLFPMSYRRTRGDLIYVRKILRGELGTELQEFFPLRNNQRTRGHSLMLAKQSSPGLPLIYRLSRRATNLWNKLPAYVVEEEDNSRFKSLLDSHLQDMWRSVQ